MPFGFCFLKAAEYIKKNLIKYIDMYINYLCISVCARQNSDNFL